MQRQWFTSSQLTPGAVVFEWSRTFTLWGFTGSHSVLLFRSVKGETRIDLVFKPVQALSIRTDYPSLTVRVATEERAREVLGRPAGSYRVLELVGPEGAGDHIVCMAVGCHEDDGEYWEPSPFAQDLTDGKTPPWRARVLGGGPDGEMTARYASTADLAAAVTERGRYLFLAMVRIDRPGEPTRAQPLAAFLSRDEAEEHVRACGGALEETNGFRYERWVDVAPITL